jgi:hypothetical protein
VREATLRDFCYGTTTAERLASEVRESVDEVGPNSRRVRIEDLPPGETVTITADMLVRLCDAALAGSLPVSALEIVAFVVVASDRLQWGEEDELVARVLYDWAMPEINWELTPANLRMFREWLTGEAQPPSEPDVTLESLSSMGFLRRTSKVRVS